MNEVVLSVESVSKRFGDVAAVRDLAFEVRAGEIFGLLGPNGAGKTTTIRMICGELAPDQGRIRVHGRPLRNSAADRTRVGFCPQDTVVWGRLTCQEQLEFVGEMYGVPRRLSRERGADLLERLGIADKSRALADTLSGGMKRRLNLALALVHDPELAVLDEPEAGLDPQSRVHVRDFLRSLARHKTVLLTTHNMDEAERLSDRVAIVDHGRLLVCDTPGALKSAAGVGELIELRFLRPVDGTAAAALDGLGGACAADDLEIQRSPGLLTVRCTHPAQVLPAVLSRLADGGAAPDEVRLRAPSLEDVFLGLTGRTIRS